MMMDIVSAILLMGAGIALIVAGGNSSECDDARAKDRLHWGAMSWGLILGGLLLFLAGLVQVINTI